MEVIFPILNMYIVYTYLSDVQDSSPTLASSCINIDSVNRIVQATVNSTEDVHNKTIALHVRNYLPSMCSTTDS